MKRGRDDPASALLRLTKRALVDVAEQLFTEHGYAATSLDAIVAGADVTKGALYHHFSGKQAIFEAVFERVESRATAGIAQATEGHRDPWEKAQAGLRAFLGGGPGAGLPPDRDLRRPLGAGPRALPRAGGALDLRHRRRDRTVRCSTADAWELDEEMLDTFAQDLLRRDVGGRRAPSRRARSRGRGRGRVEAAIGFILAGLDGSVMESGATWRR